MSSPPQQPATPPESPPWTPLPPIDLSSFECPRCEATTSAEFYGPCATCREQLHQTMHNDSSDVSAAEYEPKMNVTPNAVALKD